MKSEEYTVKGPVCVMVTTTQIEIDRETASRFMLLVVDESSSMTEAIHQQQREAQTLEGLIKTNKSEAVIRKHHAVQRMLRPLKVVNPYANYLRYPANTITARRDHKKYLGLISAITFLCQFQREKKQIEIGSTTVDYIEVHLDDIEAANRLAHVVLGQTMDELSGPSRTLLISIYNMVKNIAEQHNMPLCNVGFTRRIIREHIGWSDWQVRSHIKQLEDMEYLATRHGSKGKEYRYVLNYQGQAEREKRCYLALTTVDEIRNLGEK